MTEVTRILNALEQGDSQAVDKLLPVVYGELRTLATQKLSRERPGQTLQATALVHEAYLRLVGAEGSHFSSHVHFFGAAAEAMRRILIEAARPTRVSRASTTPTGSVGARSMGTRVSVISVAPSDPTARCRPT